MKFAFVVSCFLYCVYFCFSHQPETHQPETHQPETPPQPSTLVGGWWTSLTAPQTTVISGIITAIIAPLLLRIYDDWCSSSKNGTRWPVLVFIPVVMLVCWSIKFYTAATPGTVLGKMSGRIVKVIGLNWSPHEDKETWWWTLLTDPQVVAAIIGFIGAVIGAVIPAYQCCGVNNNCPSAGAWLKKNFNILAFVLLACCGLMVLLLLLGPPYLSSLRINSYAQYLKVRYQEPLPDDEKLLKNIGKLYIELAVIRNEKISHEESDDLMRMNIRGQTDKMLLKKPPIPLEDILKPGEDGKPIRRVLVEGAPGAGKSRLAWELCRKWEKLDSVKHYKLVVLVQLRGKRAQEAKVLSDLFPLSKNNNIEQVIDAIGNGDGVLIILEGFDELPEEQHKKGSVYIDLIERKDLLPEATVIITSRPSVSAYLMKYPIDRCLEILGFTEAKIEAFARSVNFSDSKTCDDFLQFINGNPVIKGMMYLPLNAVFVASIFEAHHRTTDMPKTMTQLYDAVTRSLIRRHLVDNKQVPPEYIMPISLQCMEDIKRLPDQVPNQLLELARIAYEGLLNEQYVFTQPGFWNESYDHLGMMKKTVSLDDPHATGPKFTFTFLHLTLQEYLSALHMSLVLSSTQMYDALVRILIRSHMINKKLVSADYHMPQTLQSMEYFNSLPHRVGDQLLVIAQIAYEGVRDDKYEFTDLANDSEFAHFGLMEEKTRLHYTSTTSFRVISNLVFLHPTLQEYLSALYKYLTNEGNIPALHWHSDLGLPLPLNSKDIVLRFLAGLCKHSMSFSCQQVGDLALNLIPFYCQVPRCTYESDSIVHENQKIQEIFNNKVEKTIGHKPIESELPFDYYLFGHYLCHYGGIWSITSSKEEEIKLLIQGLKSCDDSPKGELLQLFISDVDSLELDLILVRNLSVLHLREVTFTARSVKIIREGISSDGALIAIFADHCKHVELLIPIVFESSLLDAVNIYNDGSSLVDINDDTMNLLMNNTNLKDLRIHLPLKLPAHTVCQNTSLDFLAKWLLMFISSNQTHPKIKISRSPRNFDLLLHFSKIYSFNGDLRTEFILFIHNTYACDHNVTQQILARIPEQFVHCIVPEYDH